MLKVSTCILICVVIALFIIPTESLCVQHVALDESFNVNQENPNFAWPWFTDMRNGIRWHYNAMNPHFRAEPEATPFSWGVQDFIFNPNVIEEEINQSMWCAYTNGDQVDFPRSPENSDYMPDQNAWMWWGPIDLDEAIEGSLSFWLYLELAANAGDAFHVVAFNDENLITSQGDVFFENVPIGLSFEVGNWGWERFEINLEELILNGDVVNPVNFLGEEDVYIAFVWQSDNSDVEIGSRGAFIDDVSLIWEDGLDPQEISIDREVIDFGEVGIGEEAEELFTITNTGETTLRVENMRIDNQVFTVDFERWFDLRPDDSEEITITFAPRAARAYEGTLFITSDDPENEEIEVNLIGTGNIRGLEVINPVDDIFLDEDPGMVEIASIFEVFINGGIETVYFFEGDPEELNMDLDGGTVIINPAENFNIPDGVEITLIAWDPFLGVVEDVFMITIAAVNDPPEIVRPIRFFEAWENDGLVWIAELDQVFFDVDGDELTYSFDGADEEMRMGIDDNNVLFINAVEGYYIRQGAEITVTAEDADGVTVEDVFMLHIYNEEQWPQNLIDDIIVDEDPGRVDIADLDEIFEDLDEDVLTYSITGDPEELNMQIDENNILSFNPDQNFNIPNGVEINVIAEDEEGMQCEERFTLVIQPVNDPPEIIQDIEDIVIEENADLTVIGNLDEIFFDVDGDELVYSLIENIEELRMNIDEENVLSVFPVRDFFLEEPVLITVVATDSAEESVETSFSLMVTEFIPEVVIHPIADLFFLEDTNIETVARLAEVFVVENGDEWVNYGFEGDDDEMNMTFAMFDRDHLLIIPERNYNNPDGNLITVFAELGNGDVYQDEFILTILPVNDPPHIIEPLEDAVLQINLGRRMVGELDDVFGDIDGDQLEYSFEGDPDELHMSINEFNRLLIDPERDFASRGGWAITITATDAEGETVSDEFRILLVDIEDIELRHFNDFVETGLSMALIVDELRLNERLAPFGWEIGVFTPGGTLSGGGVWVWDQIGIPVWGDDPQTEEVEGFVDGEQLVFRIWDSEADVEFEAEAEGGVLRWAADGFVQIELFVNLSDINISLNEGWNMISTNVFPPAQMLNEDGQGDIILMTEQLRENENNHHLQILKDEIGRFYTPAWGFNNIPFWDVTQGYLARVESDVELVITGEGIPADADVPITDGWNLIAYFPTYELDASNPNYRVLSPIIQNVVIAKNATGQFMIPRFGFSNMESWRETQGYHVNVDEDLILNYPPEREEDMGMASAVRCPHLTGEQQHIYQMVTPDNAREVFTPPYPPLLRRGGISNSALTVAPQTVLADTHKTALADAIVCQKSLTNIHPTGENMSVLVSSIRGIDVPVGSEITAFNSIGQIVGSGLVNNKGQCGIAIWGDDIETAELDGLRPGEAFTLKFLDVGKEQELELSTTMILEGGGLRYETNGLSVLEMSGISIIPEEFFLSEPYPNPFNSTVRLNFGLPEATKVLIGIFDINGRKISTLTNNEFRTGIHSFTWNGSAAASGIYFVGMSAGEFRSFRKITLVR